MGGINLERIGESAIGRLREERSASFVPWVSIGEVDLDDGDVTARGTTDFVSLTTRCSQQRVASAIIRDGALKARTARNPLDKLVVTAGVWALRRGRFDRSDDCFYAAAQQWQRGSGNSWTTLKGDTPRPGYRHDADPIRVVEALAAITGIVHLTAEAQIRGENTTLLRLNTDLTTIDDRLHFQRDTLEPKRREAATGWLAAAPMRLWINDTSLPRRLSLAPLPANTTEPFWWTVEFSDFGTPVQRPTLPDKPAHP